MGDTSQSAPSSGRAGEYGFIDLTLSREGEPQGLRDRVLDQARTVFDPEIPVNIYELGLIYDITINAESAVTIMMTLTSPMCPVAESLPVELESRVKDAEGVGAVKVEITWEPTWTMEMMSEVARLELGM